MEVETIKCYNPHKEGGKSHSRRSRIKRRVKKKQHKTENESNKKERERVRDYVRLSVCD
jgi:hypothetical protein